MEKTKKSAIVILCFVVAFVIFMWPDLKDFGHDWIYDYSPTKDELMSHGDLGSIRGFTLRPERNDVKLLYISELNVVAIKAGVVQVTFYLRSRGENDYPSLRVKLVNSGHNLNRVVVLASNEYSHGNKLRSEKISLTVPTMQGEKGMIIEPFYVDGE